MLQRSDLEDPQAVIHTYQLQTVCHRSPDARCLSLEPGKAGRVATSWTRRHWRYPYENCVAACQTIPHRRCTHVTFTDVRQLLRPINRPSQLPVPAESPTIVVIPGIFALVAAHWLSTQEREASNPCKRYVADDGTHAEVSAFRRAGFTAK